MTVFFAFNGFGAVHRHGYWYGEEVISEHRFDECLASGLVEFFKKEQATSILDLGCGLGDYVKALRAHSFECEGYDGNPQTPQLSNGVAQVADLSAPLDLGRVFDWVLCLEVGEHIPKVYETLLIDNLHRHNAKGIVLSWAVKGQGGYGHVNEQNNLYVKTLLQKYGYTNDFSAELFLRKAASLWWFKNTLMVFRKAS